ncbi:hypothetical protein SLA2020_034990 [Shorea laevis]
MRCGSVATTTSSFWPRRTRNPYPPRTLDGPSGSCPDPSHNPSQELLQLVPHHLKPAFLAREDQPESVPDPAQAAQLVARVGARQR